MPDPTPSWDYAQEGLHEIATKHFVAPSDNIRAPWLGEHTRALINEKKVLVDIAHKGIRTYYETFARDYQAHRDARARGEEAPLRQIPTRGEGAPCCTCQAKECNEYHSTRLYNTANEFEREFARVFLYAWSMTTRFSKLHKEVKKSCNTDRTRKLEDEAAELAEAATHEDYKTVWCKGRSMARTGLGPKKRVYAPPDEELIAPSEWHDWMVGLYDGVQKTDLTPEVPCTHNYHGPMKKVSKGQLERAFNRQKTGGSQGKGLCQPKCGTLYTTTLMKSRIS